ncbi:unnamed protein product [marine sediment metagenome]|uniref:Uncharacterized protein n=1 Tax=marine sediment metagenome TaxID=412755 RepID=X1UEU2_9ZZZZ
MYNQAEAILRQAGIGLRRGLAVVAPGKLYGVLPGDTVRVSATIDYCGPALDDDFYAAIGSRVVVFDELWDSGPVPIHFDSSIDWVTYDLIADIPITEVAKFPWTPGWFDLQVKLVGHSEAWHVPNAGIQELSNVIEVLLAAAFQNFDIVSYEVV